MQPPEIVSQCSCSVNTQKTNLRQIFLQRTTPRKCTYKKFKENNLAKVIFLKLLTKENLFECFHQFATYQKRRRILVHPNFVEKSTCKQSGFFDHQNYLEKSKQKHRGYFDQRNHIVKSTWVVFLINKITPEKVGGNNVDFSTVEITSKKVCGNNVDFSTIEITSKKVRGNKVDFSTIEIISKKVRGNNVDFSTIEIRSKKVRGNNLDFLTIEITWKKVCGNGMDFSISEITSKKYAKKTQKIVGIWSLTYRRNIDVELTSIRRGVPVGNALQKSSFLQKNPTASGGSVEEK